MTKPVTKEQFDTLKKSLDDLCSVLDKIDMYKKSVKEALDVLSEDYTLSKKVLRRVLKAYHKRNFHEEFAVNEEFEEMIENLVEESINK